jgi:cytochrome c553
MRAVVVGLLGLLAACGKPAALEQTYEITPAPLEVPHGDEDALARGQAFAGVMLCVECHGADLGGKVLVDGFPMGRIVGPNITPGGATAGYTDADWVRAIRHGVRPDGSALFMMPSIDFAAITRGDLGDLIAWLAQVPAVEREMGASKLGPVGRKLVRDGDWQVGAVGVDHDADIPLSAEDYGAYLALVAGCSGCHGRGAGRSMGPGQPPAANLTHHEQGLAGWTEAQFAAAVRTGARPDGSTLDTLMPWPYYASLSDDEIAALWAWTGALEPQPSGY